MKFATINSVLRHPKSVLTQRPGKVEFGPRCLYGEEGVRQPGEEVGVVDEIGLNVILYGQGSCHDQEGEHASTADQQLSTDSVLDEKVLITERKHQLWKQRPHLFGT